MEKVTKDKKMTTIQWATIGLIILYILWEFVLLSSWKENTEGPLIRVDLLLLYPLILLGIVVSAVQFLKRKK
jgi:hypothetical protein